MAAPRGNPARGHDTLDQLVEVSSAQGVVGYGYDAIGRRIQRTVNGRDTTTYQYDRANRLTHITFRGQTTGYQYDAAGRLSQKTLPNENNGGRYPLNECKGAEPF